MERIAVPSGPNWVETVRDMPSATPAWGRRVIPSHFWIVGEQCIIFEEMEAPPILPAERRMI